VALSLDRYLTKPSAAHMIQPLRNVRTRTDTEGHAGTSSVMEPGPPESFSKFFHASASGWAMVPVVGV
jgi:hypothetical protein